jgi:hypothetical protein
MIFTYFIILINTNMNFNKLYELIQESVEIGLSDYTKKLKAAYRIIFDLDDSDVIQVKNKEGAQASYLHNSFKVNIEFFYKGKKYMVYHDLLHYKIPHKIISGQKYEDWDEFLKKLEKFDYIPMTDDLLKSKNIQVRTLFHIYQTNEETDRFGIQKRILLESGEMYASLAEIVQYIKNVIDEKDDSDDNEDEFQPEPSFPDTKLVPA